MKQSDYDTSVLHGQKNTMKNTVKGCDGFDEVQLTDGDTDIHSQKNGEKQAIHEVMPHQNETLFSGVKVGVRTDMQQLLTSFVIAFSFGILTRMEHDVKIRYKTDGEDINMYYDGTHLTNNYDN